VQIVLNGETRIFPEGTTLGQLIERLGLQPRFLAVERNLQVIPRERHADCRLAEGDRLEIVTLVGGG
jgi:sulfur carrier protein